MPIPEVAEQRLGERKQLLGRAQLAEQGFERAFHGLALDRLAILGAALRLAQVVGVAGRAPGRPAPHQSIPAAAAGDEAAQREILIEVFPRWHSGSADHAFLHALERLVRDQRLVLGGDKMQLPFGNGDEPGIGRARQHFGDAHAGQATALLLRVFGAAFEEAHHFRLSLKAAGGVAFEGFDEDRRYRLVAHQQLAVAFDLFEAIAHRSREAPIAHTGPRPHAVLRLVCVLLPLMLRHGRQEVFNQQAVGIFAELNRGRLQNAARVLNSGAKLKMRFQPPSEA